MSLPRKSRTRNFPTCSPPVGLFFTFTRAPRRPDAPTCRLLRPTGPPRLQPRTHRSCASRGGAGDGSHGGPKEGDGKRITPRRGSIEAQATIGEIEPGHVFLPSQFGYWNNPGRARAANELTLYEWDPVSKQPHFKYAAVKLKKVSRPSLAQPERVELHPEEHGASSIAHMAERAGELVKGVVAGLEERLKPQRSHIADYVGLLDESEKRLVKAFEQI